MIEGERLYGLLPAIYRQQDIAAGEPLRALLAVIERELRTIEADVEASYDNWFVQTCDNWVLPYLADLVGIRTMGRQRHTFGTQRRHVANTIAYRRRKGALSVLEHVLRDVTGWHVCAVELFRQIAATPHLAAPGRHAPATVDLRDGLALARAGGPFNRIAHNADVRAIDPAADQAQPTDRWLPGRYNLGALGLFVWRLRSYTLRGAQPYPLPAPAASTFPRYALHPTGRPVQLFNRPQVAGDVATRLEAEHLPLPLGRAELAADLEEYAALYAGRRPADRAASSRFYGPDRGLHIALLADAGAPPEPLSPLEVTCADLDGIPEPVLQSLRDRGKQAAVDPATGRIALLCDPKRAAAGVLVAYGYGFSAEIGGGPYHRRTMQDVPAGTWLQPVARGTAVPTLRDALERWKAYCKDHEAPRGIIRLLDNARHGDDGLGDLVVELPLGADLTIAADNGVRPAIGPGVRLVVHYDEPDAKPGLAYLVPAAPRINAPGARDMLGRRLRLDGLLIDGGLRVDAVALSESGAGEAALSIEHCTIVPGGVELAMPGSRARATRLTIASSIVGPLRAPSELAGITARDSILDGAPEDDVKAPALAGVSVSDASVREKNAPAPHGPLLSIERVTVFGDVRARGLNARDSLVAGALDVSDQRLSRIDHAASAPGVIPRFTATRYGHPGYAQLRPDNPGAVRRGAADGSELGVFHSLHHAQAEENLAPVLDEYLPVGLETGIFIVT